MAFDLDAYAEGRTQPRRRDTYLDQWDEARANTEDPGTLGGVWNNVKKGYYGAMRASALSDAKDEQERPFRPIAADESVDAAEAEALRRYEQSGSAADEAQLQRLSRRAYSANNPNYEQISRETSAANKKAFIARKAGEVEQYTRKIQSLPNAEAYQRWERATGGDAWTAFLSDPFEVTSNIVAGSASQMATQMAIGAASGFAGGAIGGAPGATIGSALGAGLSSFSGEYASSFLDSMEEAGIDMSDRDSIIKGLSDSEAISRAKSYAMKRAVPVGVFDMLSLGIAGKLVGKPAVTAVEKGITEAVTQGVLAGYPVVDVKVTLHFGSYHDVDSNELAFKMAAIFGFKEAAKKASPVILEPMMAVEVETPEDYAGNVMGDLSSRRGMVQGMDDMVGGGKAIKAEVPLSEMFGYSTTLRSMSQGRATYTMEFKHYAEAPRNVSEAIVAARAK